MNFICSLKSKKNCYYGNYLKVNLLQPMTVFVILIWYFGYGFLFL